MHQNTSSGSQARSFPQLRCQAFIGIRGFNDEVLVVCQQIPKNDAKKKLEEGNPNQNCSFVVNVKEITLLYFFSIKISLN